MLMVTGQCLNTKANGGLVVTCGNMIPGSKHGVTIVTCEGRSSCELLMLPMLRTRRSAAMDASMQRPPLPVSWPGITTGATRLKNVMKLEWTGKGTGWIRSTRSGGIYWLRCGWCGSSPMSWWMKKAGSGMWRRCWRNRGLSGTSGSRQSWVVASRIRKWNVWRKWWRWMRFRWSTNIGTRWAKTRLTWEIPWHRCLRRESG